MAGLPADPGEVWDFFVNFIVAFVEIVRPDLFLSKKTLFYAIFYGEFLFIVGYSMK
jgi:hypothetical protein